MLPVLDFGSGLTPAVGYSRLFDFNLTQHFVVQLQRPTTAPHTTHTLATLHYTDVVADYNVTHVVLPLPFTRTTFVVIERPR